MGKAERTSGEDLVVQSGAAPSAAQSLHQLEPARLMAAAKCALAAGTIGVIAAARVKDVLGLRGQE